MGAGGLLALSVLLCACTEKETFTTPLITNIPEGMGGTRLAAACFGTDTVDTFVLDLFVYEGDILPVGSRSACWRCATGEATCRHVERVCRCSGGRSGSEQIDAAFEGVRFTGLSPDSQICVRMSFLNRGIGSGPTEGPAPECPPEVQCDSLDLAGGGQLALCALTQLGTVSESESPLVIEGFSCANSPVGAVCADLESRFPGTCATWSRRCADALGMDGAWACFARDTCCLDAGMADALYNVYQCAAF